MSGRDLRHGSWNYVTSDTFGCFSIVFCFFLLAALALSITAFFFPKAGTNTFQSQIDALQEQITALEQLVANITTEICTANCSGSTFVVGTLQATNVEAEVFTNTLTTTTLPFLQYASTGIVTVSSSATETPLLNTVDFVGSTTVLSNTFKAGSTIQFQLGGTFGATGTPTITFVVELDSITYLTTGAVPLTAGSNFPWSLFVTLTLNEAETHLFGFSELVMGTDSLDGYPIYAGPSTTGVPITIADPQPFDITVQWSDASADNTITCTTFLVTILN